MSGKASGILVYGDQRGAAYADFNRDGRRMGRPRDSSETWVEHPAFVCGCAALPITPMA